MAAGVGCHVVLFPLLESLAHAAALAAAGLLAWMAFLVLGPIACLVVLLLDVAGVELPAGASWIHLGTMTSWALLLVGALGVRATSQLFRELGRRYRFFRPAPQRRRVKTVTIGGIGGPEVDPLLAWVWLQARAREKQATATGAKGFRPPPRPSVPPGRAQQPAPRTPPPAPDPHAVLGVKRGASPEEIRRAYRALVKRHHPDRAASPSAEVRATATRRTREIREAYEALKRGASPPR